MKTLIIFDVDGTLVHSNKVDSRCFADTYQKVYGKPFPTIDWTKYPHVTDTSIFQTVIREQFNRDPASGELDAFVEQFTAALHKLRIERPQDFMEVPGAKAAMDRLLEDDSFIVGIATGGSEKPARLKLRHVGIAEQEIHLSGADGKETREGIIERVFDMVETAKLSYSRTVYIGDAIWDVETTRNMQLDFVGMRIRRDIEVLRNIGAEQVVTDYLDYTAFLEAVDKAKPPRLIN